MPRISSKSAENIPENLPRTSSKSVWNVPEICPERLGEDQQVSKSPAVWGRFLGFPKSPKQQNGKYEIFFGGMGSSAT
jgi:hypothetical protein